MSNTFHGFGFIFFSKKSDIFTFQTKQIHCESFLSAFGNHASLAISLTLGFSKWPIGNNDFESWNCDNPARKYDWSLLLSTHFNKWEAPDSSTDILA